MSKIKRPRFLRSDTNRFLRLGKKRRKLQKWRWGRGKSNKMRLGRAGHGVVPTVGYKTPKAEAGKVQGLIPRLVHNMNELLAVGKGEGVILARIGARKKIDLIKKADEMKVKILNLGGKK